MSGCGGGSGDEETTNEYTDTILPVFENATQFILKENHTYITYIKASSPNPIIYSLTSYKDNALFMLDAHNGLLRFMRSPDFESPQDQDHDNIYQLQVTATDDKDNMTTQEINITIRNIEEASIDDDDDDLIPNNIETLIGSDPLNFDSNNNGILDGLDIEGEKADTFFDMLWHIKSNGTYTNDSDIPTIEGNDLNVTSNYSHYLGYNRGDFITIQVVDYGVDSDHEDIIENMDLSRSFRGSNIGDPSSTFSHGTMVAGIIAARAFNGKGVRGIIPFAKIAGSNWLSSQSDTLEKVWYSGPGAQEIAVSNNSWGSDFDNDTTYEEIMALGTSELREGKGRIYVFAAGNSREDNRDANLQYIINNRYAIATAALTHENIYASYSTPGSNIFISAYGGEKSSTTPTIGTTTNMGASQNEGTKFTKTTWSEDTEENYTYAMNGTSAAAPMVSAGIGLTLEACPQLNWREVKYLLAKYATKIDETNQEWIQNNAGFWFNRNYGFGLINITGMINSCLNDPISLPDEKNIMQEKSYTNELLQDGATQTYDINMSDTNITVEWIEATIMIDTADASQYDISLRSPNGTEILLIQHESYERSNWMRDGFRFGTPAMIDENSNGTWQIIIEDTKDQDVTGTLNNIKLQIYGH